MESRLTDARRFAACRHCVSWKRLSDARGQCWSSHRATVPQSTRETDACDDFADQLANRDIIKGWIRE